MKEIKSQYRNRNKDIIVFYNKNEIPYIAVPHLHSQYEIYYNIRGAKGFMLNGGFYRCGERDLLVIPRVSAHKVLVKENAEYERCIINIDARVVELLERVCPSAGALTWLTGEEGKAPEMVNLTPEQHNTLMELAAEYNREEQDGRELEAFAVFVRLLSFLKSCFEHPRRTVYMDEDELTYADKVMRQIEQSFQTASVSEIADRIFVNEDYANRVFKEETGITIKKYLTMRKIAEAKKYLFLGKSAREACVLAGFNDYANFMRTFKKYEGYTPGGLEELTESL